MFRILLITLSLIFVVGCSRSLEKDYKVVDASHQEIPEWVVELDEWLEDEMEDKEVKKHRFYIYTTEAKVSRDIACKIAKTESAASVAAEISTFIKENFAQSVHGDPTKTDQKLAEYVQNDLYKEVKATVTGAQEFKKYWEKRRFMKDEGASKNWDGYVCTSLIKVPKSQLKKAFRRTQELLSQKSNSKVKETVEKIMKEASDQYTKM